MVRVMKVDGFAIKQKVITVQKQLMPIESGMQVLLKAASSMMGATNGSKVDAVKIKKDMDRLHKQGQMLTKLGTKFQSDVDGLMREARKANGGKKSTELAKLKSRIERAAKDASKLDATVNKLEKKIFTVAKNPQKVGGTPGISTMVKSAKSAKDASVATKKLIIVLRNSQKKVA